MSHNDKIYVLVYKDKYRLQKEHVEDAWMIHDKQYKIIYVSNKQKDLMIDLSFTIIEQSELFNWAAFISAHIDEIEVTLRSYKISKTIKSINVKKFKNRSFKRLTTTKL